MKKYGIILSLILCLCLLCSCSKAVTAEAVLLKAQEKLNSGFEAELEISVPESIAEATLTWAADEQSLAYTAPEAIAGLSFSRKGSSDIVEISMENIREKVPQGQLISSSAVNRIFSAMDALALAEAESCTAEGGIFIVESADGQLYLDEYGTVVKIQWDSGAAELLS